MEKLFIVIVALCTAIVSGLSVVKDTPIDYDRYTLPRMLRWPRPGGGPITLPPWDRWGPLDLPRPPFSLPPSPGPAEADNATMAALSAWRQRRAIRVCTCVVRCCPISFKKRDVSELLQDSELAELNLPLVRHKRCCGCRQCNLLA